MVTMLLDEYRCCRGEWSHQLNGPEVYGTMGRGWLRRGARCSVIEILFVPQAFVREVICMELEVVGVSSLRMQVQMVCMFLVEREPGTRDSSKGSVTSDAVVESIRS
jgi:hypothetical protein